MICELLNWLVGQRSSFEAVDGHCVVVAATGYVVSRGGEATAHHPGTLECDDVDFIVGLSIPNQQLAILRATHQLARLWSPAHGVDGGRVPIQSPSCYNTKLSQNINSSKNSTNIEATFQPDSCEIIQNGSRVVQHLVSD